MKKRATYDDLLKLPEHVVGEIINGELFATPRPAAPHALASSSIGIDVGGAFGRPPSGGSGGWWILDEPELHFGADVLVPDLAGWRRERMPTIPNVPALSAPYIGPAAVFQENAGTSDNPSSVKDPVYTDYPPFIRTIHSTASVGWWTGWIVVQASRLHEGGAVDQPPCAAETAASQRSIERCWRSLISSRHAIIHEIRKSGQGWSLQSSKSGQAARRGESGQLPGERW